MRPFKYEQQELNEINTPFYTQIGLLSLRFSEIESLITHVIEKLIHSDDEMISYLLIERNVLDKNLQVLEQINQLRNFEKEKIDIIISELKSLKQTRNFFIHGVWSDVEIDDKNEAYIYCADHRWVSQKQNPFHMKDFKGTLKTRYKHTKFTLEDLKSTIKNAEKILFELKGIWETLQEINYFE